MTTDPHGGDIYGYDKELLDYSVNLNPLGMPPEILTAVREHAAEYDRYPDPHCRALRRAVAVREDVPESWLVFGNGAADLIVRIAAALRPRQALVTAPAFSEYEAAVLSCGGAVRRFPLREADGLRVTAAYGDAVQTGDELVFLCNPNNPTGQLAAPGTVERVLQACEAVGATLVVDECFLEFTEGESCKALLESHGNLIVLRAFTKLYSMAGLRLGYLLCSNAEKAEKIARWGQCWSVSTPAQVAGLAAMGLTDWAEKTRRLVRGERLWAAGRLRALGFFVYPSDCNFLLFRADESLWDRAMERGIMLRSCANFSGLDSRYYRIGLKQRPQNERLMQVLDACRR